MTLQYGHMRGLLQNTLLHVAQGRSMESPLQICSSGIIRNLPRMIWGNDEGYAQCIPAPRAPPRADWTSRLSRAMASTSRLPDETPCTTSVFSFCSATLALRLDETDTLILDAEQALLIPKTQQEASQGRCTVGEFRMKSLTLYSV